MTDPDATPETRSSIAVLFGKPKGFDRILLTNPRFATLASFSAILTHNTEIYVHIGYSAYNIRKESKGSKCRAKNAGFGCLKYAGTAFSQRILMI
jgi:hypothetical protein